jgi:oligopeptide transport system permease protein
MAQAISPTFPAPSAGVFARWWGFLRARPRVAIGGGVLLLIFFASILTLPFTLSASGDLSYTFRHRGLERIPPHFSNLAYFFGTDSVGRSMLGRSLLGGSISLAIGFAAAGIAVFLGVTVGLIAGFRGGWVDSLLMRVVDILYGLPYILLVLLFKIALEDPLKSVFPSRVASLIVMFLAIGLVSWLTMSRVIRGQVLSLRGQPFVEACRAVGLPQWRIFLRHILPNLVGPITVYATLAIPQAILAESFLSFLGIGVDPTLPTWGALAADNRVAALSSFKPEWWTLAFPCILLSVTLLALNFLGDGLRDIFDPKREGAKL